MWIDCLSMIRMKLFSSPNLTENWEREEEQIVGSRGEPGGPPAQQPYKWERYHTLTQNIKAMSLWVLSLIKCSTSTFLSDVGHITHTCTQQSHPQVWVHQFIMLTPQAELFHPHTLILVLLLSPPTTEPAAWTPLVRRTFDTRSRSNPSSNHGSDTTVGSRGEPGGPPTSRQPYKWERHHTLTQNLKAMSLWVLSLIKCSTSTFLSDVGHITNTCTQGDDEKRNEEKLEMDNGLKIYREIRGIFV